MDTVSDEEIHERSMADILATPIRASEVRSTDPLSAIGWQSTRLRVGFSVTGFRNIPRIVLLPSLRWNLGAPRSPTSVLYILMLPRGLVLS